MVRNVTGYLAFRDGAFNNTASSGGCFHIDSVGSNTGLNLGSSGTVWAGKFNASRQIPTGNQTKPRAFGVNPCIYLGN